LKERRVWHARNEITSLDEKRPLLVELSLADQTSASKPHATMAWRR
jgi:hypothetical protein